MAALRDHRTGEYHHHGLALRFREDLARSAVAYCHLEEFASVLRTELRQLTYEVENYLVGQGKELSEGLKCWSRLQPYRVLMPIETDRISAEYYCSNIRIALQLLEYRAKHLKSHQHEG
jgi:hypothetical protein